MTTFDSTWLEANRARVVSSTGNGAGVGGAPGPLAPPEPFAVPLVRLVGASEEDEQAAVVAWARSNAHARPALRALAHVPNGGLRSRATAGRMRAAGVEPGVPDLLLFHRSGRWAGLAVEMKVLPNDLTPEQDRWLRLLAAAGWAVTVCWTADQAVSALVEYIDDPSAFVGGL